MNTKEIFIKAGAFHKGHVEFKNGMHGDGWLQKDLVVKNPIFLDDVAKLQAEKILESYPNVDLLMGPITGGAIIASHVAKYIHKEFGVILGKQDPVLFHDMNIPTPGDKVVIVEDIISSGTDMKRYLNFFKEKNVEVVGVSTWLNRQENIFNGVKVISLLGNNFNLFPKEECPFCAKGEKIEFVNVRE
ncbi:MAG TPA: phosphoribosyltransferase family protein [Patescibacteria group bacterium]|nr:phosphoribosyltransferase family protein [Patescibacteria group bacterium]